MDRLSGQLDRLDDGPHPADEAIIGFGAGEEHLIEQSQRHRRLDPELFDLAELDVLYQADQGALWTFMRPSGRPSFTPTMLHDFEAWQRLIYDTAAFTNKA